MTPLASSNLGPLRALSPDRKTHVMAILNMTPDSFSDGGVHANDSAAALTSTVRSFIGHGATMIDVGGQSTAPKTPEVSVEEELSRVVPAIQHIRSLPEAKDVLISIDTYRAVVARAAIEAGADLVNDISAGTMDPAMLATVAELGATVCLMHMRGTPQTMNQHAVYPPTPDLGPSEPAFRFPSSAESEALIGSIAAELLSRVAAAEAAGIRRWRIVLDPGLGFAKIGPQNVDVLRHLDVLRDWPGLRGLPWLVGSSRKSFIGQVTGVPTPKERIWGTAATVSAAVQGGADIVRVHDVKEMAQVVLMSDSIWRY